MPLAIHKSAFHNLQSGGIVCKTSRLKLFGIENGLCLAIGASPAELTLRFVHGDVLSVKIVTERKPESESAKVAAVQDPHANDFYNQLVHLQRLKNAILVEDAKAPSVKK